MQTFLIELPSIFMSPEKVGGYCPSGGGKALKKHFQPFN
jgi:hypothetical protein